MNILIILMNFLLFFSYLFDNKIISLSIIIIIVAGIINKKTLKIHKTNIPFLLCILVLFLTLLYSPNFNEALTYFLLFTSAVLVLFVLSNNEKWIKAFFKSATAFSSIHIIATIMQRFFPSLINSINSILLSPRLYGANLYMFNNGGCAGITGQTGANAFYISIFIILIFNSILSTKNKKKTKILFLLVGLIALILTDKSGLLISIIIALIVTTYTYVYNKFNFKKNIVILSNILFCFILIAGISYFLLYNNLNFSTNELNELSSGRMDIYNQMFSLIKNNIFFGNGLLSVPYYIEIYGHNIYLQMLCEFGILGFLMYIYTFISILINTIKNYRIYINTKEIYFVSSSLSFLVFFMLYGMTGNPIYDGFSLMFWILFVSVNSFYILKRGKK